MVLGLRVQAPACDSPRGPWDLTENGQGPAGKQEQPMSPTRAFGETEGPKHTRGSKHVSTVF